MSDTGTESASRSRSRSPRVATPAPAPTPAPTPAATAEPPTPTADSDPADICAFAAAQLVKADRAIQHLQAVRESLEARARQAEAAWVMAMDRLDAAEDVIVQLRDELRIMRMAFRH